MSANDIVPPDKPLAQPQPLFSQTYTSTPYQTALTPTSPLQKSKILPIIGVGLAVLALMLTAAVLYRSHQQHLFYDSLLTRQTEINKDDFETVCKNHDACVGRFIVWDGILDGDAFQGAHSFTVKSANGRAEVHMVDPLPMRLHDGDEIIFHGFLQEINTMSPDIVLMGYVRKVVVTAADLELRKQTAAESQHVKQARLAALADQNSQLCQQALQDFLEKRHLDARFDEWAETEAAYENSEFLYSMPSTKAAEPDILKLVKRVLDVQRESLLSSGIPNNSLEATVDRFKRFETTTMSTMVPGSPEVFRVMAQPINEFIGKRKEEFDQLLQSCPKPSPEASNPPTPQTTP